ncbi:MAG: RimK family alpha-L-glutamate ligase [Planctomycetes bacterium]|nr:RimK family alpha-L-glutamate ligase [Planctomycetota bacterium]
MKLLVLSRKPGIYSTRRLREAARIEGHGCLVVDPLRCVLHLENGAARVRVAGEDVAGVDAVIPRVGSYAVEYSLAVVRQFELMGVPVLNSSAGIALAKQKWASLQTLAASGIPIPPTSMMRFPTHLAATIENLGGAPVILKLLRGMQGAGVMLAESPQAAESIMDTVWSLGEDILAQKFIAECRGRDVRVLVVGGEAVAAMRRTAKPGDFRSNIHRGGAGEYVELTPAICEVARRAAATVGLRVAGVDLLESREGLLVLEVNSSPGFQGLEEATDRDIAVEMIRSAVKMVEERSGAEKVGGRRI